MKDVKSFPDDARNVSFKDIFEEVFERLGPRRYLHTKDIVSFEEGKTKSRCCKGRRLFVAASHVALVPAQARVGAKICTIEGARFPVVLRKRENHYVLIGQCYLVGERRHYPESELEIRSIGSKGLAADEATDEIPMPILLHASFGIPN